MQQLVCSLMPVSSLTRNSRRFDLYPASPEGRAAASGKPAEESPGSTEQRCRVTPGGAPLASAKAHQGQCHRKDTARLRTGKVERVRQERTAVAATGLAR